MMDFLIVPTVVGIICATIYGLFELFARRKERIALIERMAEIKSLGQIDGKIDFTFGRSFSFWGLRGGCLLIGLGLGLIIGFLLTTDISKGGMVSPDIVNMQSTVYSGSVLLGGGLGLLLAFILEIKLFKKS